MEKRKTLEGVVTSNKMQKTVVVTVTTTMRHPEYSKVVKRNKKFYAHTERDDHNIGDKVTITQTRPLSKLKCWRVVKTGNETSA